MKLDKLARQLRRDISANPKKAAALGLMVLVAIYFWAPIVGGWTGKIGPDRKVAAEGLILEDEPVDPVAQARRARQVFPWEKVRKLVQSDPRMTPATFQTSWQNPFRKPDQASEQTTEPLPQANANDIDPALAGLALTGVAIGPRVRAATISGKTYKEGEIVSPLTAGGQPSTVEFKLSRVDYFEIELQRNGKTYKLELKRPQLAPGDEISGPR